MSQVGPSPIKRLILVVHGIGEQRPGETIDWLVGATTGNRPSIVQSEKRFLRDVHDDVDRRAVDLFDCDTRTVDTPTSSLTFAEVYWADLSRGRSGRLATLYELIKGILGLGHLVREAGEEQYPGGNWRTRLANRLVWIMHGPVTTLNLLLLVGLVLAYFLATWLPPSIAIHVVAGLTALAGIVGGAFARTRGDSYLFAIFANWLFYFSIVFAAVVGVTWLADAAGMAVPGAESGCIGPRDCQLVWYSGVLIGVLGLFWLALLAGTLILVLIEGWHDWRTGPDDPTSLYAVVCAGMTVLWLFAASAFWSSLSPMIDDLPVVAPQTMPAILISDTACDEAGGEPCIAQMALVDCSAAADNALCADEPPSPEIAGVLERGLALITPALTAFALLIFVGGWVWMRRSKWSRTHDTSSYAANPVSRLILNPGVRRAFEIGIVLVCVFAVLQFAVTLAELGGGATGFLGFVKAAMAFLFPLSILVAIGVASLYMSVWSHLAAGLGIAKDIITYFKGEPVRPNSTRHRYPLRARMHHRFNTVLETMIAGRDPDEVVVIAHSQGTVIAIEAMRGNNTSKLFTTETIRRRTLVTMGSPFTHIYGHYFGSKFPHPDELRSRFDKWINIFRIDDFVGTVVGDPDGDWPRNIPINARGHTGYWIDDEAIDILFKEVFPDLK